ncbi:PLU-1-like domain protein [Leptospira idonii]|uniref:PLU-1-like domain protein n=1 Tax=Leptospira idonii TaxID=1193500 RepID=A0A4R9M100_9LEPT|nr:PLU-1-like domain protein [Leptospira idonii]TGN19621.1 PLU-1-like domain protein [Leptospira idonii]
MEFPALETYFQKLTDITDRVAMMNNHFDATPEADIPMLYEFFEDIQKYSWETTEREYYDLFTSYFTFHVKTVEEIIQEAREILNPENREYVKKLVSHTRQADDWFLNLKKRRKILRTQVA